MTRDEAIAAALAWIRTTHGDYADRLRVLADDVVLVRGHWHVPYTAVDDDLVPLPAVEVPDDGSPPRRFVPSGPPSPFSRGLPETWPEPGPDLAVVDQDWDRQAFAHLGAPRAAVLGWVRAPGSDEYRRNPEYKPGPTWLGWPAPTTPADKVLLYYHCGWLGEDPRFFSAFLDMTLYCRDSRLIAADDNGVRWVGAYSSPVRMPERTWSWREIGVRELLTVMDADEIRVNPGHPTEVRLEKVLTESMHRWPEPFPHPPAVDREVPEYDHDTWTARVVETARAMNPEVDPYVAKIVQARLFERLDEAKANGFTIEGAERAALTDALIWICADRPGPPPSSAQRTWGGVDGAQLWVAPTLGKAVEWDYRGKQPHGWAWVAGAYTGFALGEATAGGDGTLTAALLRATDAVVRAGHIRTEEKRRSVRLPRRAEGWLDALVPAAEPVPEVDALLAAVVSGDHWTAGPLWNERISPVFDRVLSRGAYSRATHVALAETGLCPHILDLREQREVPVRDQLPDTPWERALLIAAKLGHTPRAALAAAPDPLTAALAGALVGARHGVPGLPGKPPNWELVEAMATEAHMMFDPRYTPSTPPHPGLPPLSNAMRAEARATPDGWLWCADPEAEPRLLGGLPTPTLLGAYRIGPDGEPTGETWLNIDYRPGPRRLGLPEPENTFEKILNLVTATWLPYEPILAAALDSPFLALPTPDGSTAIVRDANGNLVLPVYSSHRFLPHGAPPPERIGLRPLLPLLRDVLVVVNPGAKVGVDIRGDQLIDHANQPDSPQ
ncbi:hypothetical protein [Actinokineospora iranica]|uniref:SseB protein N-terminal domain-containing protein n=1 Tax=Actinokineospora iranica TaxID=1271860 RepID=A0A1G6VA01_9PSEU|nr:hypothetical protein [Actinokineospora iranica]SDD50509.1 hypothetical protein SAMN05216174_11222 [Actinokineospora iranica]